MGRQQGHPSATSASPPADSLLDILRRRYAQGEDTRRQFDAMRVVRDPPGGKDQGMAAEEGNLWETVHDRSRTMPQGGREVWA